MTRETKERQALRHERAEVQLLSTTFDRSVEDTVSHLLAVQAQDFRSARLALRARNRTLRATDVTRALTLDRSLLVAWLGRGTLHLVHRDDYPWLLALTAPERFATNARRLGQEGVTPDDAERAIAIVERALGDDGPLTPRGTKGANRGAQHPHRGPGNAAPAHACDTAGRFGAGAGQRHDASVRSD